MWPETLKAPPGAGHQITAEVQALRVVQLELLETLQRICNAKGLRFCAIYGTLLGAVRHKGFIPWDDDVDVAMPREDYEKLRDHVFSAPYFLQTPQSDPETPKSFFRLCRDGTVCATPNDMIHNHHKGCYIDILPIDVAPRSRLAQWKTNRRLRRIRQEINVKSRYQGLDQRILSRAARRMMRHLADTPLSQLHSEYDNIARRYENTASEKRCIWGGPTLCVLPQAGYLDTVPVPFDRLTLPAPASFKTYLKKTYRDTRVPGESERISKHGTQLMDTRRGYEAYEPHFRDIFPKMRNRRVYLFGAGNVLRQYLGRYADAFAYEAVFDNDPAKWGRTVHGLRVENPAELPALMTPDHVVLVVSIHFIPISLQLEQLGITDYLIYFDGMDYS